MKELRKIMCMILALVMCLSTAVVVVSAEDGTEPNQMYKDEIFEALGDRINPEYQYLRCEYAYNSDGSTPDEGEAPDYIFAFTCGTTANDEVIQKVIGDYYFCKSCSYEPYDLGYFIYSVKNKACYSLEAAWEYKLPQIDRILAMVGTHIDEVDNELTKYRTKIMSKLGWEGTAEDIKYYCVAEYTADGIVEENGSTPDYAVIFAHKGAWTEEAVYSIVGNYRLKASNDFTPGFIIYSIDENKIYTIREAYNQNLPGMDLVLEKIGTKVTLYAEAFEEYLKPYKDEEAADSEFGWYGYSELYYYNSLTGGSIEMPESTPDYVLVDATAFHCPPAYKHEVIGGYVVSSSWGIPEGITYYVYTPKDNRIYTLKAAYDAKLDGIMNVFTDYGLGFLLGDMDDDLKITIKDATYIQKSLANFEGFDVDKKDPSIPDWVVIGMADFDLNGKINIKDATAIQKHLAKITE